ncbi:response regulator [Bordetella pseudohinzii]|uniref:DNA-binding response regulator n=1 Tax=Bordetella pseudohinzii TaxID=1331258 RepID=A0A0J6BWY1_9BORD|nr:response regulator [Bordetella pseudohinzii]ANY15167.1 DNA-binding response regulator [Bordetella pseudohinzii]KMM26214.1 transcriptional regulator [Bordetella pseudohinzii]KXA75678.1 two-component system response regulator [Bordetella pseudohinzii]KXA76159.1 two-component system response regulator [Bordetella pseudohinzii]CUI51202.1 Transcriptional regulatory protein BasR [Bordetella pseudohinzii]
MRILLVEDDVLVAQGIQAGLGLQDFVVDAVGSADQADAALMTSSFDACLLDLGLPDHDGMTLLARLRARQQDLPVLILSAREATVHRVRALQAGADDYVLKPFDLDELGARLHAVIRRAAGYSRDCIRHGPLEVCLSTGRVLLGGQEVILARRELGLLRVLLQRPQSILTADQLRDGLYGYADNVESNALNVHIHKLRRKLGAGIIQTVRGLGYRLGEP